MNNKHLEYIIIYLSVTIACVAIAALVRISVLGMGVDEFSANTIFWLVVGFGILAYCVLTVVIQGLLDKTAKLFFSKSQKGKEEKEEEPETTQQLSLNEIQAEKQKQLAQQYTEKLNIAIRYTQEIFAPYISDADMYMLCKNVEIYAAGNSIEDTTIQSIRVKDLTTADICHFGWNIWNHFDVTDQWGIARFLKIVFKEKLRDMEPKTIKKKLKIFEPNSTIQIQEILNKIEDTK